MKTLARCCLLALTLTAALGAFAQTDNMQMSKQGDPATKTLLSPPAMTAANFDGKNVTIHYNSPSLRGRVMVGGQDPYDKVWRTGANPATSFVTETDLQIGALAIPAGSYTLYTLPEAPGTPWMLIINKQTGQWGTEYNQAMDLGRTPMKEKTLPATQEAMTITLENAHGKTAELHIRWAKIDEWVTVEAK
jgi:hypothetical protein